MKLSIIIPVYRVEHVLDRCIESVRQQSFVDWEMILVDDGSPDKCPQMCDEWAKNDKRIKVIHQLNGGLSEARNTGLAHAQGEFIAFIDSDDTLAPDTLSEALRALKRHTEYNIVEFPVVVGYGSSRQQYLSLGNHGYTDVHAYWIEQQGYLHAYAWNKVYRRCLFHEIRFPRSKVFEDIITTARLLQASGNILTISSGLYYYWKNNEGITASARCEDLRQLLEWHLLIRQEYISPQKASPEARMRYYLHLVNIQIDIFRMGDTRLLLPKEKIPLRTILSCDLPPTVLLKALILKVSGMKSLCRIHQFISKYRK